MKPPPTDTQIAALVERAGILFIYAATAVRYIRHDNFCRNPSARLRNILDRSQGGKSSENRSIDQLYTTILDAAFGDEELEDEDREDMQRVLHTVICAREPLTIDALSKLLQMDGSDRVQAALRPLWSVVHVVTGSELVTTLHASFPDYLFDVSRSKTHWCDPNTHNRRLAERCFKRIQQTRSQMNILGLESSYVPDEHVKNISERVTRGIPPELLYACQYWADHVKAGECTLSLIDHLRDFLSMRLLLWMEVLNLNKQIAVGIECLKLAVNWCKNVDEEQALEELAWDAKRFVDAFASNSVSQSTPHIYVSMLAFWPTSSPVGKHYARYTRGPVEPQGTALTRRQLAHLSTWAFEKGTTVMTISANGLLVALGTGQDVVVIDSYSGRKLLQPLEVHVGVVRSTAFSADGSRIYAGITHGRDAEIRVWDTHSGNPVHGPLQLHGHTSNIICLSFSPDATWIASAADDRTIRLWDAESGQMASCLDNQIGLAATAIAFSPNGTRIIATYEVGASMVGDIRTSDTNLTPLTSIDAAEGATFSSDGSLIISYSNDQICVWDAQSGKKMLGPIDDQTNDYVSCIGCSPDGRYIVSGSYTGAVRVWDAQNGNIILGPLKAHAGVITSVSFTPDGSRIVSACGNGLICTWDAQQRNIAPSSSNVPFDRITCVKFSSDGTRFVSGSEKGTISVWDAQTGEMGVGPIEAHTSYIQVINVLNDCIISGGEEGTICLINNLTGEVVPGPLELGKGAILAITLDSQIVATGSHSGVDLWNARTGDRVLGPLTTGDGSVLSVQFSPDGTRIVASFRGRRPNLTVWDIPTGERLFRIFDGHADRVLSVSYSPNGALIASDSDDSTIVVWDAYTGEKRSGPPTGHSGGICSVHFSPDSTRLVSCSDDRTIRIWDVQIGEMVFELLSGHDDWIFSVEYSPDGTRILSRSNDMSVRIHDARSPAERVLSRAESEVGDWTINKDGWVVDDQSRLLVWVPGDLRKALKWPRIEVIVAPQGYVHLKFDKSRMGESWMEGYRSGI